MAATLLTSGGLLAAAAQVYYVGALDRVLFASSVAAFDSGPLGTMVDAVSRTDDYLEQVAFLLMAVGLVGHPRICTPGIGWPRAWSALCVLLAAALSAIVVTSFASSDLGDPLLLTTGAILGPVWSLWLARQLHTAEIDPGPSRWGASP